MNKLFTKIATLVLGMTMAVGVGVAVSGGAKTNQIDAAPTTYNFSSLPTTGWTKAGGKKTINSKEWTYSSSTYIGCDGSRIQVGSSNKPQTSNWTISIPVSSFGSGKKITTVAITAYTTVDSATYDISVGGSSKQSGSLTTSSATYTTGTLDVTTGNIVVTLTGSSTSKAMYLYNVAVTYDDAGGGGGGGGGGGDAYTDILDYDFTGVSGSGYKTWSNKTGTSGAVYAGKSNAQNNLGYIQIKSGDSTGIVITSSSNKNVKKVSIEWNSGTSNGRIATIYGKNSAYTASSDLYDNSKKGTSAGTIVKNTSTSLTLATKYPYIGIVADGAAYMNSVTIEWEDASTSVLDSVTTTGQKTAFTTSETFSYGGTLTAHYTNGGNDRTVNPSSFKYGNSGIDPKTSGTAIQIGAAMTTSLNGKYIYVLYTENSVTVYTSYSITVTAPVPVKGTLTITTSGPFEVGNSGTFAYTLTGGTQSTLVTKSWSVDKSDVLSVNTSTGAYSALAMGTARVTLTGTDADNFAYEVSKDFTVTKYITVPDVITLGTTGLDAGQTTYSSWSGKQVASNAVYSGSTASGNSVIQMNNKDGNYIWTTTSGGVCTKIELSRLTGTGTARAITVYGSHTAITSGSTTGLTTIGTIGTTATSLTPTSSNLFEYILLACGSGAGYFNYFTISWKTTAPTNPLQANPTLDAGENKIVLGRTAKLYVTTNPTSSNERLAVTSSDNLKVLVSGSSSPYTLKGLALTTSPVTITVSGTDIPTGRDTPYSSTIQVTVEEAQQTYNDKVLKVGTIVGLTGTPSSSPAEYENDGESYTGLRMASNSGRVQFNKDYNGYFYNSTAYKADIKSVTVIGDSTNSGSFQIMGGTTENPSTVKNPVASLDVDGVNVYQFSSGEKFFKLYKNQTSDPVYISSIIVELVATQGDPNTGNHYIARQAAQALLTGLNGKCGVEGNTITSAEWEALENNAAITAVKSNAIAKGILANAERVRIDNMAITGAIIESAMYRYEYIVGTMGYKDIMGIGIQSNLAIPKTGVLFNGENSNMVAIVVIVSVVSLTAIGGYFFLKKRREQN